MVLRQVGGNILLGVSFGFLVPIVWPKYRKFWQLFLAAICFSLAIELSQFIISSILGYIYRIADIDDVLVLCWVI